MFYLWLYLKTGLQISCQFNTWLPYKLQHTSGLSHFRHGNGQYLFHDRGRGQAKPELQYFPFRFVLFCWAASCSRPKPPHPTQTHSKHFPYLGLLSFPSLPTWGRSWGEPAFLLGLHLLSSSVISAFCNDVFNSDVYNRMPAPFYRSMTC